MPARLLRGLHRAEDFLLAALLGGLLLLALLQIGLRVFFDSGLEWAEPVGRMGVLWLALLGALGATRKRRHIAIDALPRVLPPHLHRAAWAISQLATAAHLRGAGLVRLGHGRCSSGGAGLFVAGIPSWWPMLAFPARLRADEPALRDVRLRPSRLSRVAA